MTERHCPVCAVPLRRKRRETHKQFAERKTCGASCGTLLWWRGRPRNQKPRAGRDSENIISRRPWNPALVAELATLWDAGISTRRIARRMGLTNNQVVGKANRLRLTPRQSPIVRKREAPKMSSHGCQWIHNDDMRNPDWCGAECVAHPVTRLMTSWCSEHFARVWPTLSAERKRREPANRMNGVAA